MKNTFIKRISVLFIVLCTSFTSEAKSDGFCIAKDGKTTNIVVDKNDWKGVIRAAKDLGDDVRKITGISASVKNQSLFKGDIIVGTISKSSIIDGLIKMKKILLATM